MATVRMQPTACDPMYPLTNDSGGANMKLINHFADFLRDTVNLNQTRLETLESSVQAIQTFVKYSDWGPRVHRFVEQGSWAHDTIIKPIEGKEFDADLLVVVKPVDDWEASDYVVSLGNVFKSSNVYKDKVKIWDYCVTINYSGDRKIDIAPCLRGRKIDGRHEVCNRSSDSFERSEPLLFTEWINEKNSFSGNNSFRKVTRLIKYLRDIRGDFQCPSILLTTMLAMQIDWNDAGGSSFKDVPSGLRTLFGRLDEWLALNPVKPRVDNPHLVGLEDFASSYSQDDWEGLSAVVKSLRQDIDKAFETKGKFASVEAWQAVFGRSFAKGVAITKTEAVLESYEEDFSEDAGTLLAGLVDPGAAHSDLIVDRIRQLGRWLWSAGMDRPKHMRAPVWGRADIVSDQVYVQARWMERQHSPTSTMVSDFEELPARGGLTFDVTVNKGVALPAGNRVVYRVTNTGAVALALGKGRGGFETPQEGTKRWEVLQYRGVHLVEAFIVRDIDNTLVGQSAPFHVVVG